MRSIVRHLAVAALFLMTAAPAHAAYIFGFSALGVGDQTLQVVTTDGAFDIDAFEGGWYRSTGSHTPDNTNYALCELGTVECDVNLTFESNNFFAFRLGTITGTFLSATLSLFNPDGSNDLDGTVSLWDFGGDINSLLGGTGGVGAFNDLGSGILYGSRAVSVADENTQIVFNLNAVALAAIESALNANGGPGLFVIGGSLESAQVPEPMTLTLVGIGLGAAGYRRRRRTRR